MHFQLICAFCWFIFVFIIENARSKKQNQNPGSNSRSEFKSNTRTCTVLFNTGPAMVLPGICKEYFRLLEILNRTKTNSRRESTTSIIQKPQQCLVNTPNISVHQRRSSHSCASETSSIYLTARRDVSQDLHLPVHHT